MADFFVRRMKGSIHPRCVNSLIKIRHEADDGRKRTKGQDDGKTFYLSKYQKTNQEDTY